MPSRLSLTCAAGLAMSLGCTPEAVQPAPDVPAQAPVMRRLTQSQYEHAVRDLFGEGVYVPDALDAKLKVDGLQALGTAVVSVSPRGVERYENASYLIAEQALAPERRDGVMPCTPSGVVDSGCATAAVEKIGRRAWRRPLTSDETAALVAIADQAATTLGDFHAGLEFAFAALLQSPDFLMRPELGEDDPDKPGARRYTGFEVASRLSFLLWDSLPDEALLDAAERGELDEDDGIDAAVVRMVADPRARDGLRAWATDLLALDELDAVQKDPTIFVQWSDGFLDASREETLLSFEDIVFTLDTDLRDLMNTRRAFLDRTLARIYDVRAPAREGFGLTELPDDSPRAGLLGQASFLALHAHPTSSSATRRGKFIREALLCQPMPAPPGNVDTSIPEPSADAPTLRDRVASHLEVPSCAGCHKLMDPLGLALEEFDGLGGYRTQQNGVDLDVTGELDGATFDGALGLADAVRSHEDFVPCLVEQVSRMAFGRETAEGEELGKAWLVDRFAERDHRLQPLWMELALNPMFRTVGEIE